MDHSFRPRVLVLALAAVVAGLGLSWVSATRFLGAETPKGPAADATTAFDPSLWPWHNEAHWVRDQILRDIMEMTLFAAGEDPAGYTLRVAVRPDDGALVRLEGPRLQAPLEMELPPGATWWDPAASLPFAQALSDRFPAPPSVWKGPDSSRVMQALLAPTPAEIERIQAEVSTALTAAPSSPAGHASAAGILAALGLFEIPGAFPDNRFLLCRLTAHLTLARRARGAESGPDPALDLAEVGLLALTGQARQADLALSSKESSVLGEPWRRTLRMLVTGDWQLLPEGTATLAERLAAFRGRCANQSSGVALKWFQEQPDLASSSFAIRSALDTSYSVSDGHRWTLAALRAELVECREVMQARGMPEGRAGLPSLLNASPGRALREDRRGLEVVSWGTWARRFQASLLESMQTRIHFLDAKYGDRGSVQEFLAELEHDFAGLEQFPILQKRAGKLRPASYQGAILKAMELAQKHPERISDVNWLCLPKPMGSGYVPRGLPAPKAWLALPLPRGTGLNARFRLWELDGYHGLKAADWETLFQADPYQPWIIRGWLAAGPKTSGRVEQAYALVKRYTPEGYLWALQDAYPPDAPEGIQALLKLSELDPEWYFTVGRRLVQMHREPEAEKAFLAGFQKVRDRVLVSNSMSWLVGRLQQGGRVDLAERIAHDCADTGSNMGMATLAALRERQGRFKEAEELYRDMAERYENTRGLQGFYLRCRNQDPSYRKEADARERLVFPHGMTPYRPLEGPPARGVGFQSYSVNANDAGIQRDAVIVAIQGIAVENTAQYYLARSLTLEETLTLVVYQGGAYRTVTVFLPGQLFGVDLKDVTRPSPHRG